MSFDALDQLLEAAERADAVAIGPGLTRHDETAKLVRAVRRLAAECRSCSMRTV